MTKKTILVIVGVSIFTLVVTGLIVYGVLTHKEPGFLTACWNGGTLKFVLLSDSDKKLLQDTYKD